MQNLTLHYAKQYDEVVVVSGPIHDFDDNGIADPPQVQWSRFVDSRIFFVHFFVHLANVFCRKVGKYLQAECVFYIKVSVIPSTYFDSPKFIMVRQMLNKSE